MFDEWQTVLAPTCTEEGREERTCTRCGKTDTRSISAQKHTMGFWMTSKSVSCLSAGEETRECAACGFRESRPIAAHGHYYTEWETVSGSCTQLTEKSRFCVYCEERQTEYFRAEGHAFGEWTLDRHPGCTENGRNLRVCEKCGEQEYQFLPSVGHELSGIRCDKCAQYLTAPAGHDLMMLNYEFGIQLDYCYGVRENDEYIYHITYTVSGFALDPKTHANAPQGCFVLYTEDGNSYWYSNRVFFSMTGKPLTETIDIRVPMDAEITSLEFKMGGYVDPVMGPEEGDIYWNLGA